MKTPLLSIIITNFNAMQWLDACLTSIKIQSFKDYEVVFVDDGSTDGSYEYVQKKFPWCVFKKNKKNAGFAQSNNVGAKIAKGKYLFILNADTFLDQGALLKLSKVLKSNPDYSVAQMDIRKYDKSNMKGDACTFNIDPFGYPIWSGTEDTLFYADAAAMIIKRDLFLKIGGFDKRFYIYLEDLDLAWKARMCGHVVHFLPKIYVYHYAGGTSVSTQVKEGTYSSSFRRRYDAQKNNICILIKNLEIKNMIWKLPGSLLLASAEGFLYLLKGNVRGCITLHKSIWWNILNIRETLKRRKKIQKIRTVPDSIIFQNIDWHISKIDSYFTHGVPTLKA